MATINVKDAAGATVALQQPLPPAQATMANSRPVVVASDQTDLPVKPGSTEVKVTAATIGIGGVGYIGWLSTIANYLAGTLTVATHAVTQSGSWVISAGSALIGSVKVSDGTNTAAVKAASTAPVATDTAVVVAISPNGQNLNGSTADANSSPVAWSTEAKAQINALAKTTQLPAALGPQTAAASISITPASTTDRTASRIVAAATTNATNLKPTAGLMCTLDVFNPVAYTVFLKLYNKASAPAAALATPVNAAFSTATAGGTLANNASYFYRVSAINANGETLASTETSQAIAAPLTTPVNAAFSTTATGGTLAAGTYFYRVSAINAIGETLASTETSQTTTGATSTVTVNWGAVSGATGYKIYGRATGAELLIATVGVVTTYIDPGTPAPSGALPVSNTTATATNTVVVNWGAVTGVTGYKVYGRTTGAELLIATVGVVTTYTDLGSITPAGALPVANTTFDTPIMTIPVPSSGGYSKTWPNGLPFSIGISYAITKLQPDSDTTVLVAGDLTGNTTWV